MKNIIIFSSVLMLTSFNDNKKVSSSIKQVRTNILLIVADDLGYTDLGCYGGDILTPNIDALATQGIVFNNFHTSPICAPTRSMILTGNNNHVAGLGSMFPVTGTPRQGKPGYEG